ncbi:septum formation initiator family protein [Tissierella sp.]|uniref:FtsB family cell division protein n=1 Tax=Tissierella sp. TaxID=41274 RepID=UPI00286629B2|nr:septum formation initiator family protein [Tissierella sp.]MDR7855676.1 septum formation initiator family protein [Tissierella sp.]
MANKKRKKKRLRLIHMIIGFFFIYITLIFWNQKNLMEGLEAKRDYNLKEIQVLEKEIENLNEEIENSNSLQFVEKIARDELGMVKPREIIYIDKNKKKNHFLTIRNK